MTGFRKSGDHVGRGLVAGKTGKPLRDVAFTVRFSRDEMGELRLTAAREGLVPRDYIRRLVLDGLAASLPVSSKQELRTSQGSLVLQRIDRSVGAIQINLSGTLLERLREDGEEGSARVDALLQAFFKQLAQGLVAAAQEKPSRG